MYLCLFEDNRVSSLRPLVETRAVYDLRLGFRTILETTQEAIEHEGLFLHARPHIRDAVQQAHESAVPSKVPDDADILFVNGRLAAEAGSTLSHLQDAPRENGPRAYVQNENVIAAWLPNTGNHVPNNLLSQARLTPSSFGDLPTTAIDDATLIEYPWDLLDTLRPFLARDIGSYVQEVSPPPSLAQRSEVTVHESVRSVNPDRIQLGDGASVQAGAILNAQDGPIYVGPNAEIQERAVLRGPCAIGRETTVKIGANLEGLATGPVCKVGGEIHDAIIHGYSNKGHSGFLGHSYVGAWCNLGADTNTSNLKNDYGDVRAYSPSTQRLLNTGRQFVGLFMGDHAKCGINTMFNTGTVVGTSCNIFGGGFQPQYIPPFSWGGPSRGFTTYRLEKALAVAERVMARRDYQFTDVDRTLLTRLFDETESERDAHHS